MANEIWTGSSVVTNTPVLWINKYLGEKIGYETEIYLHDFVYESNILFDESIKLK